MAPAGSIRQRLSAFVPRLGLAGFLVCLASGLVLVVQYRPVGDVFRNVEEITSLLPYGGFLRQLHYVAGQFFVICMLVHTGEHFLRRRYSAYPPDEWCRLVLSLGLCLGTLFTGFILKGDLEGIFAGRIMQNSLRAIPLAGVPLSRVFLVEGEAFFYLPFLHHCLFLPLLICYLIRRHVRNWLPGAAHGLGTLAGLGVLAVLVPPAAGIPPGAQVASVQGPWFFLGLQYMLQRLPVLWAGVLIPGAFVAALLALPYLAGGWARGARAAIIGAVLAYAAICFLSLI